MYYLSSILKFAPCLLLCFQATAQQITPGNHQLYRQTADSLRHLLQYDSAVQIYENLTAFYAAQGPDSSYVQSNASFIELLLLSGDYTQAEALATDFINQIQSDFPEAWSAQVKLHKVLGTISESYKGQPFEALARYRQAIGIAKAQPKGQYFLPGLYKDVATTSFQLERVDSTLWYFELAIDQILAQDVPDSAETARTYRQLALVSYIINERQQAMQYARQGLQYLIPDSKDTPQKQAQSDVYGILGMLYQDSGLLDSAYYFLSEAQETNLSLYAATDNRLAIGYQNLASLANAQNDFIAAEEALLKALKIAQLNTEEDPLLIVYIYNGLGNIYYARYGAYDLALEYYEQALRFISDLDGIRERGFRAQILSNIANIHAEKADASKALFGSSLQETEHRLSIDKMAQAIEQANALESFDEKELANFHFNQARAYHDFKKHDSSRIHFDLALQVLRKSGQQPQQQLGLIHLGLSGLHFALGDIVAFEKSFKQAEKHFINQLGPQGQNLTILYNQTAEHYLTLKKPDAALALAAKARESNTLKLTSGKADNADLSGTEQTISSTQYLRTLWVEARVAKLQYELNGDPAELKQALLSYRGFAAYSNNALSRQINRKDRVTSLNTFYQGFLEYLAVAHQLSEIYTEEAYVEEALQLSHLSSAFILKSTLAAKRDNAFAGVPKSMLQQEELLEAKVSDLTSQLLEQRNQGDNALISELENKLFSARADRFELQKQLSEQYESYFELKYQSDTVSISEIQAALSQGQSIIEYVDHGQSLFAFVITKNELSLFNIDKPDHFNELINDLSLNTERSISPEFMAAGKALYQLLIRPLETHLEGGRVIIVPDAGLWNINFDLLINDTAQTASETPHYLLKDFAFSYLYSSAMLPASQRVYKKNGMAAFSYDQYQGLEADITQVRSALSSLPGSALEVHNLSQNYSGVFYFGQNASEVNFKQAADQHSVLHLAVHGEINQLDYDQSRLFFRENPEDSTEDNYLHPFELYSMRIDANLVALSACNSGSGIITRGEGIMSLGRAFQYAGVNSLLLSKWDVSDGVAPQMISNFYQNLNEGLTKDEALRQAKLNFLENADNVTMAPYYWGSFFVLGNSESISLKKKTDYNRIAIILFLVAVTANIVIRVLKKSSRTKS